MRFSFLIRLAFSSLLGHKLRSFMTIFGVAISIGFICFLVSFGYGLQNITTKQIADDVSLKMLDVTTGSSKIVAIDNSTIDKISSLSEVTNIYPQISAASDLELNGSKTNIVTYGYNRDLLDIIKPKMLSGKLYQAGENSAILLNVNSARKITKDNPESLVGKKVKLNIVLRPDMFAEKKDNSQLKTGTFTVSGIFDEGNTPYAFISLDSFTTSGVNRFTAAKVELSNSDQVDLVKPQIEHLGFKASSIKSTIDQIEQFFGIFNLILIAIGTVAVIVASLSMFNTLTISLMEKTREVGIMKVLGATKKDIRKLFIFESLIIGLLGGITGMIVSSLLGWVINSVIDMMASSSGNSPVDLFYFPAPFIAVFILVSLAISIITGLYPSGRATRIQALDALRYE